MTIRSQLWKFFFKDKINLFLLVFSVVLQIVAWAFVYWKMGSNPADLRPVRYSVYFGITEFGPISNMYRIPGLGAIFLAINAALACYLYTRNPAYARVILGITAFLQVLMIIPLFAIFYFGNIVL